MVGIVIARAQHTAKIRAKSLIGQKKAIVITAHLCSETAVLDRNTIRFVHWSIRYSTTKHAVHSYLRSRTSAQTEYVMGSTVYSFHAMAFNKRPLLGVHFFRGRISLKNWTISPLFSHDTSSFKEPCLLIYLIEAKVALYGPHLHW
jgi:hypothetical protein